MTTYQTIHTTAGLATIASAEAAHTAINLVNMAVGDGNGNPTTPDPAQTSLVREVYRTTVNRVYQDPVNPVKFTAEMVIPASVGGFVMREAGIFDANGTLFAVANLPDTYKPQGDGSEGAFSDTTIRMVFEVSNTAIITLQVDPSVAIATQQWVINNVEALPPGGTTGQVLAKDSNADYAASWHNPTDVNVVVATVEENQTLAAGQTAVTLATCTTVGLALFIEGVRLRTDEWTPNATDPTKLTLATSYSAGTKLTAVQNEPVANSGVPLLQAQNLADVPDKTAARTNLGVPSLAYADQKAPAGTVIHFAGSTAPTGWLKCNGATVSRTAYAALFAAIGTTFGTGDGSTTFRLPDLRGEFLRGYDDGRGVDSGRGFGTFEDWATAAPKNTSPQRTTPTGKTGLYGGASNPSTVGFARAAKGGESVTATGTDAAQASVGETDLYNVVTGDSETRPRNVALLLCIKY